MSVNKAISDRKLGSSSRKVNKEKEGTFVSKCGVVLDRCLRATLPIWGWQPMSSQSILPHYCNYYHFIFLQSTSRWESRFKVTKATEKEKVPFVVSLGRKQRLKSWCRSTGNDRMSPCIRGFLAHKWHSHTSFHHYIPVHISTFFLGTQRLRTHFLAQKTIKNLLSCRTTILLSSCDFDCTKRSHKFFGQTWPLGPH